MTDSLQAIRARVSQLRREYKSYRIMNVVADDVDRLASAVEVLRKGCDICQYACSACEMNAITTQQALAEAERILEGKEK